MEERYDTTTLRIGDKFEHKDSSCTWCVRGFTRRGDVIATMPHEPPHFYPSIIVPTDITAVIGNIYEQREEFFINQEAQHE